MSIALTNFARGRLFGAAGRIQGVSAGEFLATLNSREPEAVLDGYADFCKLHVHPNWTQTACQVVPLGPENEARMGSAYEARADGELPVLTRWLEGVAPERARYLIVILYSREQMASEGEQIDADWGIVGCLATMQPRETPMAPITLLRNALGVQEGGSGVPLDRAAYEESVQFWSTHANWRPTEDEESV